MLSVTGLDAIPTISKLLPDIPLNEAFMWFGAFALAFNILTRYTAQIPFLNALTNSLTQLCERLSVRPHLRQGPLPAAPLPAPVPDDSRDSARLARAPVTRALGDPALAARPPLPRRMGLPVRTPGRAHDPRARYEPTVPVVGLDVGVERARRARCEYGRALRAVSASAGCLRSAC